MPRCPLFPSDGHFSADAAEELLTFFAANGRWPWEEAGGLVRSVTALLEREASLTRVRVPAGGHLNVVGDLHGQLFDLLAIFRLHGVPSETNPYLFNGDFVDRGSFSVETLLTLLAWKAVYPRHVFLARGNHEAHDMNLPYGFTGEVLTKYDRSAYEAFQALFDRLPLGHVVNDQVLVTHGGLPRSAKVGLKDIERLDRVALSDRGAVGGRSPDSELFTDLLWADPHAQAGLHPSQRGEGLATFGPDVTDRFLAANSLQLLIRSHEVKSKGFEYMHNGKCLTVFSAPRYADSCENRGAVVRLTASEGPGEPMDAKVLCFDAAPRPSFYVPAMAYSPMNPQCRRFLSPSAIEGIIEYSQRQG